MRNLFALRNSSSLWWKSSVHVWLVALISSADLLARAIAVVSWCVFTLFKKATVGNAGRFWCNTLSHSYQEPGDSLSAHLAYQDILWWKWLLKCGRFVRKFLHFQRNISPFNKSRTSLKGASWLGSNTEPTRVSHKHEPTMIVFLGALGVSSEGPSRARVRGADFDMPVDPNEPTYCECKQISFGEMIACDNVNVSSSLFLRGTPALSSIPVRKTCQSCYCCRRIQKRMFRRLSVRNYGSMKWCRCVPISLETFPAGTIHWASKWTTAFSWRGSHEW